MLDPAGLPLWVYAAMGCAILWAKMKASQRSVYGLTDMICVFVPDTWPKLRGLLEIAIYLTVGSLIAIAIITPSTPAQAFAAGLGWTSLTTR
jgi:hypothetical protein